MKATDYHRDGNRRGMWPGGGIGLKGWREWRADVAVSQPGHLNLESGITTEPLHIEHPVSTRGRYSFGNLILYEEPRYLCPPHIPLFPLFLQPSQSD